MSSIKMGSGSDLMTTGQKIKLKAIRPSSLPQNDSNLSANTASTLIRLGSVYYKLGNRLEELQMYRDAKAVYKSAFGENHTFVAGARKNIGMVLAERGEYET